MGGIRRCRRDHHSLCVIGAVKGRGLPAPSLVWGRGAEACVCVYGRNKAAGLDLLG